MSDPSSMSQHDDGPHAVLVASGEKLTIEDGLRPKLAQYCPGVLGAEGG